MRALMSRFPLMALVCLAGAGIAVSAEPDALSDPATGETPGVIPRMPTANPDADTATEASILPDAIPARTKRSPARIPLATRKPASIAAELDLLIRYRKARTFAETNDNVAAAWEDSRYPKSDAQKRAALIRYYDLLFSKMLTFDRGIAPLVMERRKAYTSALSQPLAGR